MTVRSSLTQESAELCWLCLDEV